MRGEIAWLKSPVRHRTLAPFDGITRIRFKGSSNWTSQPLRLPRIFISSRIRLRYAKSTTGKIAGRPLWMSLQIWNVIVIRRMKRSQTP